MEAEGNIMLATETSQTLLYSSLLQMLIAAISDSTTGASTGVCTNCESLTFGSWIVVTFLSRCTQPPLVRDRFVIEAFWAKLFLMNCCSYSSYC